ncbi:MAG TPA: Zn-binding domain-containing protein, partial [Polyangiaceae bacterium]|nr:Zn-binding domain-containing protein [Polyangiaceae bacterium]
VRKVEPDYYTDAMTYTQVSVIEESATGPLIDDPTGRLPWPSGWGEVAIVEKVVGYKKIKFFTHENAGYGDVRLPEMQMHTTAFWLTLPEAVVASVAAGRPAAIDGLRGVGLALETVSTLALMCDPRDLGTALGDVDEPDDGAGDANAAGDSPAPLARAMPSVRQGGRRGYHPTLFLYEHVPGGTGLAERIWEQRDALLGRTREMIEGCPCPTGCPACVGPGDATRKAVALLLLRAVS